MDYSVTSSKMILDLHELEELSLNAYENALIYKERTKKWHDICITRREFNEGELVLLFTLGCPEKLHYTWSKPFEVTIVSELGAIEVWSKSTGIFFVNGQRLEHYHTKEELEKGITQVLCP